MTGLVSVLALRCTFMVVFILRQSVWVMIIHVYFYPFHVSLVWGKCLRLFI